MESIDRTTRTALQLTLLALGLCLLALALAAETAPSSTIQPAQAPRPCLEGGARPRPQLAAPAEQGTRRLPSHARGHGQLPEASLPAASAAAPPIGDWIRVRGRVRIGGLPAASHDLAFHRLPAASAASPARAGSPGSPGSTESASHRPDERPCAWDFTDERGLFELLLPAGRYRLVDDATGAFTSEVLLPEGESDFVLEVELPAGFLRGRALDTRTGLGLAGLRVELTRIVADEDSGAPRERPAGAVRTAEDGHFALRGLAGGTYRIELGNDSGPLLRRELRLPEGGLEQLDLHVDRDRRLPASEASSR